MHVTLCTDGVFPQALGGMQRHSRHLAEELAAIPGVKLSVIHPHRARIFDARLGINEVLVEPIDTGRFYFRELWRYSSRVADALDKLAPDAIISQGFSVWKNIELYRSRLIVHPHGLEMFQTIGLKETLMSLPFRWGIKGIMRRSAVTVSLGGILTPLIQKQVNGNGAQVVVIPNAVQLPEMPSPYPQDGPLKLLFVGRFAFNKGLDVLMHVAQRLEKEGSGEKFRFVLAGDGPLLEHYREKGLPGNVELAGRVDDERLMELYAECHALVLPTRFEGMPTVVLEAMAMGRPVLVSNVGATAELVDERNGFLLPKGDAGALYTAIKDLQAMDHQQRIMLGMIGYEKARAHYQWPVVAAAFHRLALKLHGSPAETAPVVA